MNFIGYHGTDAKTATIIDKEGFADSDESAWLGAGVYFFEDFPPILSGCDLAYWWVNRYKHFRYWVIYKAYIESDNILDLVQNKDDQNKYKQLWDALLKKHIEAGKDPEDFSCHDVILQLRRKVEVIRCMVDASKPTAKLNSYIDGHPQIQLCVYRNSGRVIKSYSRYKEN